MDALSIIVWPLLILVLCLLFRDSISALIRPNPSQSMTVEVGPSGVKVSRVAAAAAAVAAGAAVRADQGQPINQTILTTNLAQGIEASLQREDRNAKKQKILWVDDTPSNNDYLVDAFRDLGIEILEVKSTDEAAQELKNNNFSLLISDMQRPPDNTAGLTLLEHIREKNYHIPIIIFASAWASKHRGKESDFGFILITNDPSEVYSTVLKRLLTSD